MRNSFTYHGLNQPKILQALLNISTNTNFINILVSNLNQEGLDLPKDYINYDIIAGVGSHDILISNNDSFQKLHAFHHQKKDWLFGCFAYDLKNEIEDLSSNNIDNFNANNLCFFVPEYVLLLNHKKLEIKTYNSKSICDQFVNSFDFSPFPTQELNINFKRRDTRNGYLKKIKKIKEHIQKGDIYEINYCQEFYSNEANIFPEPIFLELNKIMKTPFSSFLKLQDKYILSSSPERFLRKSGNYILSQPIKGTRKRGVNKSEDRSLINNLENSTKDFSENIMIVDLVRNDLSISAKNSLVKVEELCKVYTFEKVHQMISSISSEIDDDMHFLRVLKGAFPMGSMTGAPKIRAMELIDKFEGFKRGFFSGSIGYITPEADFDFNVVIRTILYNLTKNYLSISVGGAITINSVPVEEYEECLIKAQPLFEIFNFELK